MKRCKLWKKAAAAVISLSLLCAAEIPAMAGIFYRPALTEIKTAGGTMLRAVSLLEEKYAVAASAEEAEVKTADTEAAQPQEREVAESEVDAFFSNSVLVGDSVMLGYRNYCMKSTDPFLKSLRFLASGSFSVHNALWPVNSESVHPIYQGAQRPV